MIELLNAELYKKFHGKYPEANITGLALTSGDVVLAIVGTVFIADTDFIVFGMNQLARKRDIVKGWRAFKAMLTINKTYYALIDRDIKSAHGLLTHYGFRHFKEDIYILENK